MGYKSLLLRRKISPMRFVFMPYRTALLRCMVAAGLLLIGIPLASVDEVAAQELDCSVSVDYSQLSGSDYDYLDELERRVEAYLNEHAWTDDRFRPVERIACNVQIILQEAVSLTEFRGRLVVATLRPIHGTTQATPVVRLSDAQWQFEYGRGTPLVHNLNSYNALTSMLDYYAYLILGYDYDTFSARGGTAFFEQAREIADRARAAGGSGWSQFGGSRNRSELLTQLLDSRFRPLREAYFEYHFGGLDRFVEETEEARENVLELLNELNALSGDIARSHALDLFFAAKYQELPAVFEGSSLSAQAYGVLSDIDPSHLSEYNRLVN